PCWCSFKESFVYGQSSSAQGCRADTAFGAVLSHYDYCVSVDCSSFRARICLGRDRRRRNLAFTLTFAETTVWSPRPGRAADDAAVVPAVYYSHCTAG